MIVRIAPRCRFARAAPDALAILSCTRFYGAGGLAGPESLRNRSFMGRMEREDESHGDSCRWAIPFANAGIALFAQSRSTGNHYEFVSR